MMMAMSFGGFEELFKFLMRESCPNATHPSRKRGTFLSKKNKEETLSKVSPRLFSAAVMHFN